MVPLLPPLSSSSSMVPLLPPSSCSRIPVASSRFLCRRRLLGSAKSRRRRTTFIFRSPAQEASLSSRFPGVPQSTSIEPHGRRFLASGLRGGQVSAFAENSFKPFDEKNRPRDTSVDKEGDKRFDPRKIRRIEAAEVDLASRGEYLNSIDDPSAKALKRPRLVWTSQLHRRFVDVITHLGIRNAVPKTIMQLRNVEGLTKENIRATYRRGRVSTQVRFGPGLCSPC